MKPNKTEQKEKKEKHLTTKAIAYNGIFMTFVLLFVFLAGTVSNIQMVSYCFSSLFLLILIQQSDLYAGITFYIASSALCLLLLPNKLAIVPYLLFFGPYGIWYFLYLKHNKRLRYYLLHFLMNHISIIVLYVCFHDLFVAIRITSLALLIPAIEVFLLLYHYMYGKCNTYIKHLVSKLPQPKEKVLCISI